MIGPGSEIVGPQDTDIALEQNHRKVIVAMLGQMAFDSKGDRFVTHDLDANVPGRRPFCASDTAAA